MKLLKNWDFMRFLRLGIGLWIGYSAIAEQQFILGLLSAWFIVQAVLNMGCSGGACGTLPSTKIKSTNLKLENTTFEEVK